jgi:hypothetical protein
LFWVGLSLDDDPYIVRAKDGNLAVVANGCPDSGVDLDANVSVNEKPFTALISAAVVDCLT